MAHADDKTDSPEFVISYFLMQRPLNPIRNSVSIINALGSITNSGQLDKNSGLFLNKGITKSNKNFSYRTLNFVASLLGFHMSPEHCSK